MHNTPLKPITYRVFDHNRLVMTGTIGYGLLHLLEHSLTSLGGRILELNINGVVRQRSPKVLDYGIEASDRYHKDRLAYYRLHTLRELDAEYQRVREEHAANEASRIVLGEQRKLAEERMLIEKEQFRIDEQTKLAEKFKAEEDALKLIIERDQLLYESIVSKQKDLTENYLKYQEEETARMKLLEQTIINNLHENPLSSVDALNSEVGKSYSVHQQIAKCIEADTNVALSVLASPASLWDTSYNIMEALALKAKAEPSVAEAVGRALPEDSTIVYMLKKLGYIKTLTP